MIDSNREEFEKLPEIAERLHTVFYNEYLNQYHAAMINSGLSVRYIQGAWYAFQEQQKKLDCCREENKALLIKLSELKLVPVETLEECLSWACCASSESWSDEQRDEIDKHYKVIEKAMIEEN